MSKKLTDTDIQHLIHSSPWFSSLPGCEIDHLTKKAQQKVLKKNSYLYSIGDYTQDIYCLVEGRIRITMTSSEGQVFAVTDLEPVSWFGEAVLVHEKHRLIDAIVKQDAIVLFFPKQVIMDICTRYPNVYKNLFEMHVLRNRGLYEILSGMLFYPLRARLAGRLIELIKDHGENIEEGILLNVKLNQKDFAHFSMGSRQSVNKILREWYAADIVGMHNNKYIIRNLKALRAELVGYMGDLF